MKSIEKEFSNEKASITLEVEPEDDGLRLDEACKKYLKSQSRQTIKKMIANGQIHILNRKTKNAPNTKLRHMDLVEVFRFNESRFKKTINILYEDEFLIAIDKEKGMFVHPTGIHHFHTASTLVESLISSKVYPIHRLDSKTSGVLIFAKTKECAQKMRKLFDERLVEKEYSFESLRSDTFSLEEQVIDLSIGNDEDSDISLKQKVTELGKSAITILTKLERKNNSICGIAIPKTGRLHQIRCHLAYLGIPIIGDNVYGNGSVEEELKLHCCSMEFEHPFLFKNILIQSKSFN